MTSEFLPVKSSKRHYFLFLFFILFINNSRLSASGFQFDQAEVVINEVMASNTTTIEDRDGDYPDWIELYNSGDSEIDLAGFGLSDDADDLYKWTFPTTTLKPGEFLLIFASDKNYSTESPYLHTNFKIKAGGETLLLTDTSGFVVDKVSSVEITGDLSWGRKPDGGSEWLFFTDATPGESNTTDGFAAYSAPVTFSHNGGFYQSSISVEITSQNSEAEIRYTLDGSDPDENSTLYSNPIDLEETIVLRARSYNSGLLPGKILTNTYLFNENTTLPVISLSTDPENMFSRLTGIYENFRMDWERPVHIEFFETDKQKKFSENAGIKIGGNNTRGRA